MVSGGLALAVLLGACAASTPPAATAGSGHVHGPPVLVPTDGGTATVALDSIPTTLNDHTVAGDTPATRMVASAVWAQVFEVGPGPTPRLNFNVVDSAEVVSVNPQTVVYQIDPRAVWSDGVPISADDFLYAWQSQRGGALDIDGTPVSVASMLGYRDIASVTGSNGGRTVTVVFRTPFADWESLFADLLPAHIAEQVGWNTGFDQFDPSALVSGGPWQVESWQPGIELVLGRNPRWWGAPPSLERVVLRVGGGGAALASALLSGQVQVAAPSAFDTSFVAQVTSSPALETQTQLGTSILQLEFNVHHAPLDSVAVRQGIAHAINRPELAITVGQPVDHSVWEDNDHLFANTQAWYVDDATDYEQPDPATGARLLAQGGLVPDDVGTWTSHGHPVTLVLSWADDDPWSAATGPLVAGQLVAAGFDVTARPVASAQLLGSVLANGSFDLALVPVVSGAYPSAIAAAFSPTPATTGSAVAEDWSGFDDAHVDAAFAQAAQELATTTAQLAYQQIDQMLWTQMPTLPLFAEPALLVWSAALAGVHDVPGGLGPLENMRVWALLGAPSSKPAATSSTIGAPARAG